MDELQQVINFTDADLKANADGLLSQKQRQLLEARKERSLRLLSGVVAVVASMMIGAFFLGNMGLIVLGIMAIILGIMALVEFFIGYQTYTRDLSRTEIETIQGVVHYIWRGDSALGIETRPSGIRVGDIQFLLMEDQARAFIEGDIYALHFAPASHSLLSAKRVILEDRMASDAEVAYWEASAERSDSMQNTL